MTKILLIRHALTDSAGVILSGRSPGLSLNQKGRKQALLLAERLVSVPIAAIYSSPLDRAVETALPIAEIHHLPLNILDDFQEVDFGKWTNCTLEELKEDDQFKLFNAYRSVTRIPGGETTAEVQMRMIRGIEKLKDQYSGKTVAVISHADPIRSAIVFYAGIHLDLINRIEISPASFSILELFPDSARIQLLNRSVD